MPIYSYRCMGCGKVTDKYMSMKDKQDGIACSCGHLALRSYTAELATPQIFEPYFDMHLADEDHPDGTYCTGYAQKRQKMKEMGFEYADPKTPDPPTKRAMWAQRNKVPLTRHFVGVGEKLKPRNLYES
jgi:putative FmdB family regulatory protein